MKLPKKVGKGERVKASDWNQLIDYMESCRIQPGPGYRRRVTEAGTVLNISRRSSWKAAGGDFAPFSVRELVAGTDGEEPPVEGWNVRLEPGRVVSQNPSAAGNSQNSIDYKVPKIGLVSMDEKDEGGKYPQIFVPSGSFIYCKIARTGEGILTGDPEIVVEDAAVTDSAHYQPGDAGAAGDEESFQMSRLCELKEDPEDAEKVVVRYWRKSDIELGPILQQAKNIGDGADSYKRWDKVAQRFEFYRVKGARGLEEWLEDDTIKLKFDAENVGDGQSAVTAKVYVEPDDEDFPDDLPVEFRMLGQGEGGTERQIRVTQDQDAIRIHGNGVNRTITFVDCDAATVATFVFEDGLLTGSGDVSLTLGDCGTGGGV